MHYVLDQVNKDFHASNISKAVDILRAIKWATAAWNKVTVDTIKSCFAKCGKAEPIAEDNDDELDEKGG